MSRGKTYQYRAGEPTPIVTEIDGPPNLDFLQKGVEGHIETVPFFDTYIPEDTVGRPEPVPCIVFCNEEGKLEGQPINYHATQLWDRALRRSGRFPNGLDDKDVLVGSILIITGDVSLLRNM